MKIATAPVSLAATAVALSLTLAACVESPTTPTTLSTPFDTTTFQGYGLTANAPVQILVLNQQTNAWDVVATTTTSPTVTIAANTTGQNPALYSWSVAAALASPSDPSSLFHWNVNGGTPGACSWAYVRVTVGGFNAYTYGPNGASCVQNEINSGQNAVNAAIDCRDKSGEISFKANGDACIE